MEEAKLPSIEFEEPQMTCGGGGGEGFLWFVAGVLLALALTSCRSVKYVPVERTVTDSIVYHDTVVSERLVPYRDSVVVRDTTSFLSNPYAYSRATFSGGTMTHVLGIWPLAKIDLSVPSYAEHIRIIREPQIVEVEKKLTWMQQKKLDYFGLSVLANIVLMVILAWLVRIKGKKR